MSEVAQGVGWWRASDGRWYPPELHPSASPSRSPTIPGWWVASDGRWYPPELHPGYVADQNGAVARQQLAAPCVATEPAYGPSPHALGQAPALTQKSKRKIRPLAVLVGLVVGFLVLYGLATGAGYVAGRLDHKTCTACAGALQTQRVTIPARPPTVLAGEREDPGGLRENVGWEKLAQTVAAHATVSFASVYGTYPPTSLPTTRTFLAIGESLGTLHSTSNVLTQLKQALDSLNADVRGAHVTTAMVTPSYLGGQIDCGGVDAPTVKVGECYWATPDSLVQVVTWSPAISELKVLSEQIVRALRH